MFTERGAGVLRGLDIGICGCGAMRSFRSRECLHCLPPTPPPRPVTADDCIAAPEAIAGRQQRAARGQREVAVLPPDWRDRVRALPGHTLPHVPACVREATAAAMAQGLEALLADDSDRDLELGRAKVLLAPPPKGLHLRSDLETPQTLEGRCLGGSTRAGRSSSG